MMGINIDRLDALINKNNGYYDSINSDIKQMSTNINALNNLYSGSDLQFLFQDLVNQVKDVNSIPMIIKNYSEVLNNVKISYKAQDINLKDQVNHMISKTNI